MPPPSESALRGVAVLVVTCPCALALAAPLALAFAARAAARVGIVFREPDAIERAAHVDTVVLDKTGTLTTPSSGIAQVEGDAEALQLAASAEWGIDHPLASALRDTALAAGMSLEPSGERRLIAGHGVEWRVDDRVVRVGLESFASEGRECTQQTADGDRRKIVVSRNGRRVGAFAVTERILPEAHETIARLHSRGVMLHLSSGDDNARVARVARELGIEHFDSQQLPLDKEHRVASLEAAGRRVAFLGDGVNDAPALARAHLGIAVTNAAPQAFAAAPIVLLRGGVAQLEEVTAIARRATRVVRSNIVWAVAYNAIAIPLAAIGVLGPVLAPLAMIASSLSVTASSLRLAKSNRTA